MAISFGSRGSFKRTEAALQKMAKLDVVGILKTYGQEGVSALAAATPYESGIAQNSWGYEVFGSGGKFTLMWTNSDVENGFPVVIMLQYGYGTGTGGYVKGRDYINPAIRPVFDAISEKMRKVVTSA